MTGGNCLRNTFKRVFFTECLKKIIYCLTYDFFKMPLIFKMYTRHLFTPVICLLENCFHPRIKLFCKMLALKLRKINVLIDLFYPYKKYISVDQLLVHWQLIFFNFFYPSTFFCCKKKIVQFHLNSQLLTKHILGWCSLKYQMFFFLKFCFY